MIIVGIDPGSLVTGYGVISVEGSRCRCVHYGVVRARSSRFDDTFPHRLKKIYSRLEQLLREYSPEVIAVEDVFYARNAQSALRLGHTRGVVLLAAAQSGVPLVEYSPLEVKKAVVGYGRADKQQVQLMVRRLLSLKQQPEPHDAADALAIALCHVFNGSPGRRNRSRWSSPR